ncbi:MAG: hypothetical protein IH595_05410 [Bacteroidales bacterium]|nr:hypothetical protein [Bacteroidales bacterium]
MDKTALKEQILADCKAKLNETLLQLEFEMNEALRLSSEYGAPKDRYDPYRTKLMRQHELYSEQYKKTTSMMIALERIQPDKLLDSVQFGAVVITDKQNIFVSTGMGKFESGGISYYAISYHAPVFKAMENAKSGDSFEMNGQHFEIKDVF